MISSDAEARARKAVEWVEAQADAAEAATTGGVIDAVWGWIWNIDTAQDGAAESARQTRNAAVRLRDRFVALVSNATATDDEADQLVRDASVYGAKEAIAAGQLTSAAGGAAAIADGIASDLGDVARKVGFTVGPIVLVVGVAVAVLVIRDLTRKVAG